MTTADPVRTAPRPATVQVEGHKLHHHPDRVAAHLAGEQVYPLYVEFSPVGACNHRCTFCAYDYIGYPNRRLETERTRDILAEMATLGVKSTLWAGEGEPLLHPEIDRLVEGAKSSGIDAGMFSNASALVERKATAILPHLTFLRASINAGDRETYAAVHQAPPEHFDRALENLARAVELRDENGWEVTLGAQIVLLPTNLHTAETLTDRVRDIGLDYLSLKPFVQHPDQQNLEWPESFRVEDIEEVASRCEERTTDAFQVHVRRASFRAYVERTYDHCFALPFFGFILSDGNVYSCGPYYENPDFNYGNIYEQGFAELWRSARTKKIQAHARESLDVHSCMPNCRPDAANRYLGGLHQPPAHVNFI